MQDSPVLHVLPQLPQLRMSEERSRHTSVQQVSSSVPSQETVPHMQSPPLQAGRSGPCSACRTPPQLDVSVRRFTQRPPQQVVGSSQTGEHSEVWQVPLTHAWAGSHSFPQPPQLSLS